MLTNEQRAHDLAISILQYYLTPEGQRTYVALQESTMSEEELEAMGEGFHDFNFTDVYFAQYQMCLELINERFPQ